MQKRERIYSLDVLKILGTVIVVFHHYQQYMEVKFPNGVNYFFGQFFFGYVVELFFLLSGFFAWHYVKKIQDGLSFRQFFGKTWLRFAPFLVLGAFASGLLHIVYQKLFYAPFMDTSVSLWNILKAALGIHSGWMFAPQEPINGHTWYISVLLLCYVILWCLVRISQRKNISPCLLFAGMTVLGIFLWETKCGLPFLYKDNARGYMSFFFGLLMAQLLEIAPVGRKGTLSCLAVILLLTFLFAAKYTYVADGLNYLLLYVYFPCFVIVFLSEPMQKLFRHTLVGTVSALSVNTYMWHGSILRALRILTNLRPQLIPLQNRTTMYLVMVFCFLCGTVSHFALEKPYNKYLSTRSSRQIQQVQ